MKIDDEISVLSLQDIEECANAVMTRANGEVFLEGIRSRRRLFGKVLIYRYCYYMAAGYVVGTKDQENRRHRRKDDSFTPYKFTLEQVGEHIGTKSHASVINGMQSFEELLRSGHGLSCLAWNNMKKELTKKAKKKVEDDRLSKLVLIGGI